MQYYQRRNLYQWSTNCPFIFYQLKINMGFGKSVDIKKLPNRADILSCITDVEIFSHFLGGIPRKPISSPIRKDSIPSFSLFYSDKYEKMMYKDFATGESSNKLINC